MDVLLEKEQHAIQHIADRLQRETYALAVLVLNKEGQEVARSGQTAALDITSLSSLFAGNVAATHAIARLLHEEGFEGQTHEGTNHSVHLSVVSQRLILGVLFDKQTSLGLVRLRVKRAVEEMSHVVTARVDQQQTQGTLSSWAQALTQEDIEHLFGESTRSS